MRLVRFLFPVLTLLPVLAFVLVARPVSSQPSSIEILSHTVEEPTALDEAVLNAFRMSFRSRDVELGPSQVVLYVSTSTFTAKDGQTFGTFSVAEAQRFGKKMVDAGAEHEIWYAGRNVTSFTPEAREIRQYMTREILEGSTHISTMRTVGFERSDVSHAVEAYVADYWDRHTFNRP